MTPSRWQVLPVVVGMTAVVAGLLVLFVMWFYAGEQTQTWTVVPLVLAGGCAGMGLIVAGGVVATVQGRRLQRRSVENAVAHVVIAAAAFNASREGDQPPGG